MASQPTKVLFDTDIGSDIDDALALAYLLCQERCELLGITTGTGEPEKRAEMASAICRHVGRADIPIHSGAPEALLVDIRQKKAPQAAALGSWARQEKFPPNTAIDFLRQTIRAHPGQITLLATGPMTNIALLLALDPQIATLLNQVVVMCGRFFTSMGGEWNAINDPHATAVLYGNGRQARPARHVSFGLDVTMQCTLEAAVCRQRFTAKVLEPVRDFAEIWFHGAKHVTFHDPLAAACIFEPDICKYRQGFVEVSLAPPTLGWTILSENEPAPPGTGPAAIPGEGSKPHTVAASVDSARFFEHYFGVLR